MCFEGHLIRQQIKKNCCLANNTRNLDHYHGVKKQIGVHYDRKNSEVEYLRPSLDRNLL